MNPISVTVTGRLGDDPRSFTTREAPHTASASAPISASANVATIERS